MKRNGVSSNRRSKTETGTCAQDRSGFVPSAASTIRRRARRAQLGAAPPLVGGPTTSHASRQRARSRTGREYPQKDVKNEDRSGNVYENKGSADTMTDNYSGFCAWFAPSLQKWTKIQRAFWLNPHKSDDNWGEAGTKIDSSVHRPIDPLAEYGVVLKWRDDPMTR